MRSGRRHSCTGVIVPPYHLRLPGRVAPASSVSFPTWGLQNYVTIFQETLYLRVLANTVVISASGYLDHSAPRQPLCVLDGDGSPVTQRVMAFVVLVPFWTIILVRTYAGLVLLQRRGLVNRALEWTGLISEPLDLVHNRLGVYIGISAQPCVPFMSPLSSP